MVREAVILTVAALLECRFEIATHEQLARDAGVDVEAIRGGRTDRLRDDVRVAVEIARRLITDHRIPDDLFARARGHWDEPALVDLMTLVGYYSMLAAILNGVDVAT
jgi:4-carboxymuconolactone decarboxylase